MFYTMFSVINECHKSLNYGLKVHDDLILNIHVDINYIKDINDN